MASVRGNEQSLRPTVRPEKTTGNNHPVNITLKRSTETHDEENEVPVLLSIVMDHQY